MWAFVVCKHRRPVFLLQDPNDSAKRVHKIISQAILYLPITGHWPAVFAHSILLLANTRVNSPVAGFILNHNSLFIGLDKQHVCA